MLLAVPAMGRLADAFFAAKSALFRPQNVSGDTAWLNDYIHGIGSAAGVNVTPMSAMGVPTVAACVNVRSAGLATIPLKLYRRVGNGKEVASDHPLYSLLHDSPNDEMTSSDFRRAIFANSALRNSGFAMIIRDGAERVRELVPIPNSEITPERDPVTKKLFYLLNGEKVSPRRILHARGLTFNGVVGLDMVSYARDAIGLACALQDHASRYFPNSISPSYIFSTDSFLKPEQLLAVKAEFESRAGLAHAHKPLILQGGTKPIPANNGDNQKGQFIEAAKRQDKAICQIFGVPQSQAGIMDDAHYDNVEQDNGSFVTNCLMPNAVQFEQELNRKLLGPIEQGKYFFQFEFGGLLRAKAVERAQTQKIYIEAGVMNRDEVRALENMDPVPGGSKFLISQNVQMLDDKGDIIAKPAPTAPATNE